MLHALSLTLVSQNFILTPSIKPKIVDKNQIRIEKLHKIIIFSN